MRRLLFSILPLLLICVSCHPIPGVLYGYEVEFDDHDLSNGNIGINIFGALPSNHKNPILCLALKNDTNYISTDLYELSGDAEHLTCCENSEKKWYYIYLASTDINYNIKIHLSPIPGNYELICRIKADISDDFNYDDHFDCLNFTL